MSVTLNEDSISVVDTEITERLTSLEKLITDLTNIKETMSINGWKGNSSTTFYANIDTYLDNLNNLYKDLENIQVVLKDASNTMQQSNDDLSVGM